MTSCRLLTVTALMVFVAAGLRLLATSDFAPDAAALSALPIVVSGWRGVDAPRLDRETEDALQADTYLMRTYTRAAVPLTLFVAYYATQRAGHTMHSPLNCLPGSGWEWIDRGRQRVALDSGGALEINRNIARRSGEQVLVYYWYQSRGRTVASEYRNKLLLVRDAIALHRSDAALVRVTAASLPNDSRPADYAMSFIRVMYPALTRHLPG